MKPEEKIKYKDEKIIIYTNSRKETDELSINMNKIKEKGLEIKPNIKYPLNITYYKKEKKVDFRARQKSNVNKIPRELIRNKLNPYYELGSFLNYL